MCDTMPYVLCAQLSSVSEGRGGKKVTQKNPPSLFYPGKLDGWGVASAKKNKWIEQWFTIAAVEIRSGKRKGRFDPRGEREKRRFFACSLLHSSLRYMGDQFRAGLKKYQPFLHLYLCGRTWTLSLQCSLNHVIFKNCLFLKKLAWEIPVLFVSFRFSLPLPSLLWSSIL